MLLNTLIYFIRSRKGISLLCEEQSKTFTCYYEAFKYVFPGLVFLLYVCERAGNRGFFLVGEEKDSSFIIQLLSGIALRTWKTNYTCKICIGVTNF